MHISRSGLKIWARLAGLLALLTLVVIPASAQTEAPGLNLRLTKIFGYNLGSEIQGTFRLRASGPADLTSVTFWLDDQVLAEVTAPPFEVSFTTDSYPLGVHTLRAEGRTAAGAAVSSQSIPARFVSPGEGMQFAANLLIPILGITLLAFLIVGLITASSNRKLKDLPPGTPRNYGMTGGVICENCGRPFQATPFGINLAVTSLKVQPCPFCGKWGARRRRSLAELRAAEARELEGAGLDANLPALSEDEQLRRDLDSSRYRDN